jgi:glycosyltransferase involved in cell wall biosynthesis
MRILFIHQYFRTPEEGGGIRSYYMSKALIEAGHEVEMVTAHNQKGYLFKNVEGIKVHYLPVYYENKLGFIGRSIAFIKFLILSLIKTLKLPKPDICYASSSPLTVGVIAIILKRIKKTPFIFEVMDLWPEAPVQLGFIRNPFLKKFLYWLERKIYKESKLVVAASPGMEEGVRKVSPETSVITIPNMSDCDFFRSEPKKAELIKKYGVENKFVCCYTGAIGFSNNLEVLIALAEYLKKLHSKVHFLIAGEGARLLKLEEASKKLSLTNISFLGHQSKDEIAEIYNVSDINLIIFNKQPILETNSPNKFFDGIAAGLPTLININGWVRNLIEKNECGKHFNSDRPEEFLEKIKELETLEIWKKFSYNARKLAEEKFNKDVLLKEFMSLFKRS